MGQCLRHCEVHAGIVVSQKEEPTTLDLGFRGLGTPHAKRHSKPEYRKFLFHKCLQVHISKLNPSLELEMATVILCPS